MRLIILVSIVLTFSLLASAQTDDQARTVTVNIYLQKTIDGPGNTTDDFSKPVKRTVNAAAPLRGALEELFSEKITEQEEKDGFWSPIYGMKFEGVSLKNGTATVRFSQPPDKTNYGSLGPFNFADAIEKTAKQFPSVKRVKICAVGATMIDSELDRPFPRCAGGAK
jgi:hypothetical protein